MLHPDHENMKKTLAAPRNDCDLFGCVCAGHRILAQPKVTVSPGSGTTTVYWTSKFYSGSHHPYITYLATLMKGQPIRPMVTLDFRDVEASWRVQGDRVVS
jgi:hypothetical protein